MASRPPLALPMPPLLLALLAAPLVLGQAAHLLQGRPFQTLPHRDLYARQIPEPYALSGALYTPTQYQYYDTPAPAAYASYPYVSVALMVFLTTIMLQLQLIFPSI